MSTHLPTIAGEAVFQPVTLADLHAYFHKAGKSRSARRIGTEFEIIAVDRQTGRQISYQEPGGIGELLTALVERRGWEPIHEDGLLTTLLRDGGTISLEPGAQVEYSSPPLASVQEITTAYRRFIQDLQATASPRIAWLGIGVTPFHDPEVIRQNPRHRHALMAQYLPRRSASALAMMRATASTQVALDYENEADAARKLRVALHIGPLVNSIWANSPLAFGRPAGVLSQRAKIWQEMDSDRSGLLLHLLEGDFHFEQWVDYLLDVPMMFLVRDGRYTPADGRSFREFLNHGIDGRFPTLADWELQLTTVFPEVRLKRFLEIRGADAVPPSLVLSIPAFWRGLLYDDTALAIADELTRELPADELPQLFDLCFRQGLRGLYRGRSVGAWCRELLAAARAGLPTEERSFLDPASAIAEDEASPAAAFIAANIDLNDIPAVLRRFEIRFDC